MINSPFSISFQKHISPDDLAQDENVLAAIRFSHNTERFVAEKPVFSVALTDLENSGLSEVWRSPEPVQTLTNRNLQVSFNGEILFGLVQICEEEYKDLEDATRAAYEQILGMLESTEHKHLLRIWNYFSSINDELSGLERYRQFCLGRQQALDKFGNFPYAPPAATAIGTTSGDMQIYFIAARTPGIQLENPRQTSAFLYPSQYGEVSPAFSRATYKQWGKQLKSEHLYISGTASIVGHKSQHLGQAEQQLTETLDNIAALIQHGNDTLDLSIHRLQQVSHLKVYLRDAALLDAAKAELHHRFGDKLPTVLYLQGDVCRSDLLVEIEASYFSV